MTLLAVRSLVYLSGTCLAETGLPLRAADGAWDRLLGYRSTYGTSLRTLIDCLLVPARFWGRSAEGVEDLGVR